MKSILRLALAAGIAAGSVESAVAAVAVTQLNVQLTLPQSCQISSPGALTFSANNLSADIESQTSLTVTCTNLTPYTIAVGLGQNAAGGAVRKLKSADGATVNYRLCSASPCTSDWDNTAVRTGNGAGQIVRIFGRVPAQDTPANGTYLDTVDITLNF